MMGVVFFGCLCAWWVGGGAGGGGGGGGAGPLGLSCDYYFPKVH